VVDSVASALAAANTSKSGTSRTALAQNFEMFLVLLTEQLKNQDPLSPLDSNEFVTQLVQFSSVEQQINQNSTLEKLVGLQVASVGGATVGYLGKEIRVDSDEAHLGPDGAAWTYGVDGEAGSVALSVVDATGKVVYTAEGSTAEGEHGFVWDGKDNSGQALPQGAYTLQVAAMTETKQTLPTYVATFGIVTGVDLTGAEPVLMMGQAKAPFSRIQAVRDAPVTPPPTDPTDGGETPETEPEEQPQAA
jgi:flagellar basal-body rod modification protein FlgD